MERLLTINDLNAGYQKGSDIIHQVNLTLDKGEALAVVGKNGCGKSTLAKAIVGLTPFKTGEVVYCGQSLTKKPIDKMRQLGIAIMQQGAPVFPGMSVKEHLQLAVHHNKHSEALDELKEIIPLLNDTKSMNKKADRLSGGERHQLSLAMTLATARSLVILDEPTAGLGPTHVVDLYNILRKTQEAFGTTFLLIEQNIEQAEDFASQFAFMEEGKIVYRGNDSNIIEELMFK